MIILLTLSYSNDLQVVKINQAIWLPYINTRSRHCCEQPKVAAMQISPLQKEQVFFCWAELRLFSFSSDAVTSSRLGGYFCFIDDMKNCNIQVLMIKDLVTTLWKLWNTAKFFFFGRGKRDGCFWLIDDTKDYNIQVLTIKDLITTSSYTPLLQ
jgi:hypothetical protein